MMAISKGKAEGGQGGKRGHSNMDHWEFTEEISEQQRSEDGLERRLKSSSLWLKTRVKMNRTNLR